MGIFTISSAQFTFCEFSSVQFSKQIAAATPAKAKRGGERLVGKEVTQKTQSISRALEHTEELRQREAARVEEAARRLEIRRMADQIQRGE